MALAPRVVTPQPLCASTPPEALVEPITPTESFFVRNHFPTPALDARAWRLTVDGACASPLRLSLADLQALPRREEVVTLECAGNGRHRFSPRPSGVPWDDRAVATARFAGASLADVLHRAGVEPGVVEVLAAGADAGEEAGQRMRFARSLPIEEAMAPQVLLAWEMNGAPLTSEHGAPVRLLVPGWYAVASVKWLTELRLLTEPFTGFFQRDRYVYRVAGRPDLPVTRMRRKALLAEPREGARLPAGREVVLRGQAWGGEAALAAVEVSVDGGGRWHAAELDTPASPHAWTPFAWRWRDPPRGRHVLLARAVDAAGNRQPMRAEWNEQGYGYDGVIPVAVEVA